MRTVPFVALAYEAMVGVLLLVLGEKLASALLFSLGELFLVVAVSFAAALVIQALIRNHYRASEVE